MNTQFHHKRNYKAVMTDDFLVKVEVEAKGGVTVALESIPSWFLDQLKVGDTFEKRVGKAHCSKDDNYSRKSGRELSESRMKLIKFTVESSSLFGMTRIVTLIDNDSNRYTLCSKQGSKNAHFIEYYNE